MLFRRQEGQHVPSPSTSSFHQSYLHMVFPSSVNSVSRNLFMMSEAASRNEEIAGAFKLTLSSGRQELDQLVTARPHDPFPSNDISSIARFLGGRDNSNLTIQDVLVEMGKLTQALNTASGSPPTSCCSTHELRNPKERAKPFWLDPKRFVSFSSSRTISLKY